MFAEFFFFDFRKSSETASKSKLAKSLKSIRPKEQNMLEDGTRGPVLVFAKIITAVITAFLVYSIACD